MTLALLVVFVVPFTLSIAAILNHADPIVSWTKGLAASCLRPPQTGWNKFPRWHSAIRDHDIK
jgi:hypothetical protein